MDVDIFWKMGSVGRFSPKTVCGAEVSPMYRGVLCCADVIYVLFRFITAYNDLKARSPEFDEDQLFVSAADFLRSNGFTLLPASEVQKVCLLC